MTIGERIRYVRENYGEKKMSMAYFAEKLGVTSGAVSQWETNYKNKGVSNQIIVAICREFDVNKHWIETGEGDPFLPKTAELELAKIVSNIRKGDDELKEFRTELVKILLQMDDETMKKYMEHICSLADVYRKTTK